LICHRRWRSTSKVMGSLRNVIWGGFSIVASPQAFLDQ
jgi:hypothetical protein